MDGVLWIVPTPCFTPYFMLFTPAILGALTLFAMQHRTTLAELTLPAIAIVLGLAFLLSFIVGEHRAHANPSTFCDDHLGAASTSVSYMTIGTGTTTLALSNCLGDGSLSLTDLVLNIQFNASNTSAVLGYGIEYSNDGIDWYGDNTDNRVSTSTVYASTLGKTALWTFASSSPGGATPPAFGTAASRRSNRTIWVPPYTRYVRVYFFVPNTSSANSIGVWAQFIGKREQGR